MVPRILAPRILALALLLEFAGQASVLSARAQLSAAVPLEVNLAYSADRTNGVVGGCGCFWMEGGKTEASAYFGRGLSVVAELAGEHADSIDSAHQSLSFVSYLFGPRYSLRTGGKFSPFTQFLVGGAHGFDALFPNPNGSNITPDALAFAAGGGLNVRLSRRLALRAVQADYFQTRFPNGGNNEQGHLRVSGGVVFRFGESGK